MSLSTLKKTALLGLALCVASVFCHAAEVVNPKARLPLEGLTFHSTLNTKDAPPGEFTAMTLSFTRSDGSKVGLFVGVRNEPAIVFSPYVEKATIALEENETYLVYLLVNEEGRELFAHLTAKLARDEERQHFLAVLLDGELLSAPSVRSGVSTSEIPIFGNFTKEQAEKIAGRINQFNK